MRIAGKEVLFMSQSLGKQLVKLLAMTVAIAACFGFLVRSDVAQASPTTYGQFLDQDRVMAYPNYSSGSVISFELPQGRYTIHAQALVGSGEYATTCVSRVGKVSNTVQGSAVQGLYAQGTTAGPGKLTTLGINAVVDHPGGILNFTVGCDVANFKVKAMPNSITDPSVDFGHATFLQAVPTP
jgi:hypothetical protein